MATSRATQDGTGDADEQLLAGGKGKGKEPEKKTVTKADALEEQQPAPKLRITPVGNTLKIELILTSPGRPNEMPFAALDVQKKQDYLTSAQDTLTRFSIQNAGIKGFNVDKITASGEGSANIYAANVKFNSTAEANRVFNSLGLVDKLKENFDNERKQVYMQAAAAWTKGIENPAKGGASVDYGTRTVKISDNVAFDYYWKNFAETPGYGKGTVYGQPLPNPEKNKELESLLKMVVERDKIENKTKPKTRASGEDGEDAQALASSSLVPGNDRLNGQFQQALKGTNGDRDAAAVAVETISNAKGYKPDQDISVIQGKNGGLIVSQGEGASGLNLAVPQSKQGDFDRVSTQMAQVPQTTQVAQTLDQPERARTM